MQSQHCYLLATRTLSKVSRGKITLAIPSDAQVRSCSKK